MFRYRRRELSSHVVISYLGYTGAGKTLFPTGKGGFLMTSVEILGGRRREKKIIAHIKRKTSRAQNYWRGFRSEVPFVKRGLMQ